MRILLLRGWIHPKNENAIKQYNNIQFAIFESVAQLDAIDLSQYDCVYSPSNEIDVSKYPNTVFIFGPHLLIDKWRVFNRQNAAYIMLSKWVKQLHINTPGNQISFYDIPFGVDTDKFSEIHPIQERTKVFVYFKYRNQSDLSIVKDLLNSLNIRYKLFDYHAKYNEEEYLCYLQQSKYGIWLGAHESQGFALQEALSCNVPLFVWSVSNMKQEHSQNKQPDEPATTVPYWDERCGEYFLDQAHIKSTFKCFLANVDSYNPRAYVLETLSIPVCEQYFINTVNDMKNNIKISM